MEMNSMMSGECSGWMMAGMTLFWALVVIVLLLGAAALIKYLRTKSH